MAIILTPFASDWMLMLEEAICKEELYFRMCLRKDMVARGRRAPGGTLRNEQVPQWLRRRNGEEGLTAARFAFSTAKVYVSPGSLIRPNHSSALLALSCPTPMSSIGTMASSNSEKGTQAAVCKSCCPRACRCCLRSQSRCYCRSWSVNPARASACCSRSRSCCCCRAAVDMWSR